MKVSGMRARPSLRTVWGTPGVKRPRSHAEAGWRGAAAGEQSTERSTERWPLRDMCEVTLVESRAREASWRRVDNRPSFKNS